MAQASDGLPITINALRNDPRRGNPHSPFGEEVPVQFRPVVASRWLIPLCVEFVRIFLRPADWQSARGAATDPGTPRGERLVAAKLGVLLGARSTVCLGSVQLAAIRFSACWSSELHLIVGAALAMRRRIHYLVLIAIKH